MYIYIYTHIYIYMYMYIYIYISVAFGSRRCPSPVLLGRRKLRAQEPEQSARCLPPRAAAIGLTALLPAFQRLQHP